MKRFRNWALCALAIFWIGCGGDGTIVGGPPVVPLAPGPVPPGTILSPGTGPVNSEDDAIARVFNLFLGIQARAGRGEVRVGTGLEPLLNLYIAPGGPFGNGVTVTDADDPKTAFTLDQPYYLFWVDPNPIANLGHTCSILYLRAADGLLVEQVVDFDPLIGDRRLLELESAKAQNLVYTHEDWRALGFSPGLSQLRSLEELWKGVGEAGGPRIGGLGVAGATEARREADLDAGRDLFEKMGGNPDDFDSLDDDEGDRKDGFDLEEALAKASEGLGEDDKFLFVLSSHGGEDGTFQMGTDFLTWEVLCELIDQNVTAGNVNLVIDTCYAGLAIPAFDKWNGQAGKRVRILTSTGTTPSYSRANGLGINLECVLMKLEEALAKAKEDGELTLDELEQAMEGVEVTDAEIDKKICELIGDVPGAVLDPEMQAWKDDYLDKPGAGNEVDRSSGSRKGGFDDRPPAPNDPFLEFLTRWAVLLEARDVPGLTPLYIPGFNYNGQDVQQINGLGGTGTIQVSPIRSLTVGGFPADSFFDVFFEIDVTRSVAGPPAIAQTETRNVHMRLQQTGPSDFLIHTQQTVSQTTTGTVSDGTPPPPFPPLPTFGDITIFGPGGPLHPGDAILPGDLIRVEGLFPDLTGQAGVIFGGQFHTFQPQGGGIFLAQFPAPPLPTGFYLVSVFAEHRNVVVPGQQESFAGRDRTFEFPSSDTGQRPPEPWNDVAVP
ncbi:hypothetical protein DYH09_20205 [bacterium CPR1]|nr:hypothetical protein [bacterium CPR1]